MYENSSMQYQIRAKASDQILKAGTIRCALRLSRNGILVRGFNSKSAEKKMVKVAETFNMKITDLEMLFFEKGS